MKTTNIADTLIKSSAIIDSAAAALHYVTNDMDETPDHGSISAEYMAKLLYGIAVQLEDVSVALGEAEANLIPAMEQQDVITIDTALDEELNKIAEDTGLSKRDLLNSALVNYVKAYAEAEQEEEDYRAISQKKETA